MAIGTVQEPDRDQLLDDSQAEARLFNFTAEEMDIIAFRLWRRASSFNVVAEDCGCCKGEAQQCYAACR
jgi:hypothetical protein